MSQQYILWLITSLVTYCSALIYKWPTLNCPLLRSVSCWNSHKYICTSLNTWSLRFLQAPEKSTLLFLTLMYFRSSHHSLNCSDLRTRPMLVTNSCRRKLWWAFVWKRHPPPEILQTRAVQTRGRPASARTSRISSVAWHVHGLGKVL